MPMLRIASPRSSAFVPRAVCIRMSRASGEPTWLSTNKARRLTTVDCWPAITFLRMGKERSRLCHQAFKRRDRELFLFGGLGVFAVGVLRVRVGRGRHEQRQQGD